MLVGLQASCHCWYPGGLYLGCSGGELLAVDTVNALRPAALQKRQEGLGRKAVDEAASEAAEGPGSGTGAGASLPVVAKLEYGGQAAAVEALAVNKDCVAIAGQCPVVR